MTVTQPDILLNTWTHVAATFDGSKLRLYINGVFAGGLAETYVANTIHPLRIEAGVCHL